MHPPLYIHSPTRRVLQIVVIARCPLPCPFLSRLPRLYNARIWPTFLFIGSHGKMSRCRFLPPPPSASTSLHFRVSCSRVFFPPLLFFAFSFWSLFPFPSSSSLASSAPQLVFPSNSRQNSPCVPRIPTLSLPPWKLIVLVASCRRERTPRRS